MDDRFEWKAEIKFNGTAVEFNRFIESMEAALEAGNITIEIPEWVRRPRHLAGCMPLPIGVLLDEERIRQVIHDMPQLQINYIKDIAGGIRTPHLHLGDNVVLLDRAKFKAVVVQVAQELAARRVEATEDYVEVMSAINAIASLPIPVP